MQTLVLSSAILHIVKTTKMGSMYLGEVLKLKQQTRYALTKGVKVSFVCAVWKSFWLILEKFFLKGGYKDGKRGFIIAACAGLYKFIGYIKLYEKNGILDNAND